MLETVCIKCLKINRQCSLIKQIKCGNLDSRNNSEVDLVFGFGTNVPCSMLWLCTTIE